MFREHLRKDLIHEAEIARGLAFPPGASRGAAEAASGASRGAAEAASGAEEIGLASAFVYAQVLHALWDSGFYEHVRAHPRFVVAEAVADLGYDPMTFRWLLYYLVGRGVLRSPAPGEMELTEKGRRVTNTIARGLLNLYVGGYSALLANLGPLLRREIHLDDPRLDRSARHAAAGTEDVTCVHVVPQVVEILKEHEVRTVLDLGCGTGGFLIQWAHLAGGAGVGVDMSAGALSAARANAASHGVADRLSFLLAEVGEGPLPIDAGDAARVDAITAMFMLHEFGRAGDAAIARVLSALRAQFPGRLLLALEMAPVDVLALNGHPPPAMDALDYHFIHPLSRQGEPRPKEAWQAMYEEAGMKLLAVRRPRRSPVLVHVVRLGGAA
jgi:ubiquinone/menaquinone biosynthesis C-methylase UbiE